MDVWLYAPIKRQPEKLLTLKLQSIQKRGWWQFCGWGIVGCGVSQGDFGMVCIPRFWIMN